MTQMGKEYFSGVMKRFGNWREIVVVQHCKCTKCPRIVHIKTAHYGLCEFHLSF